MSDINLQALQQIALVNPILNPLGYMQHAINPNLQPNALDNPVAYMPYQRNQNKELQNDKFTQQTSLNNQQENNKPVNFCGKEEVFDASYENHLKDKRKRGFILSLFSGSALTSSIAAYKFSATAKKYPWVLFATGVISTVGSLIGLSTIHSANKELKNIHNHNITRL